MTRVGLTGGIGSGKTTVARVLEQLGVPVYYADERGKWLSNHNPEVIRKIRGLFGDAAYPAGGAMDRKYIAGRVFEDAALLSQLNAIIHPAVQDDYLRWVERYRDVPYTILETAILFESGFDRQVDRAVTVLAPVELRIARTVRRDETDEASVRARIAAQMSDDERAAKADFVLHTDDEALLIPRILELHGMLTET
jgi:dephospho-CoA kinase